MRGSALLHDRVISIDVAKELFRNMGNDPNYTWMKIQALNLNMYICTGGMG